MKAEVKITKCILLCTIISLVFAVVININIDKELFIFGWKIVLDNFVLTLVCGIFTGSLVILIEKIYRYEMSKSSARFYLYNIAGDLYAEIYYWHRNIRELNNNKSLQIPINLFSNKMPMIQNMLSSIRHTDYYPFWKKERFFLKHEAFISNEYWELEKCFQNCVYFDFAINGKKYNLPVDYTKVYDVLNILDTKFLVALDLIEKYLKSIEKTEKRYNWEMRKGKIQSSYLGLYNIENLDDFIARNKI